MAIHRHSAISGRLGGISGTIVARRGTSETKRLTFEAGCFLATVGAA